MNKGSRPHPSDMTLVDIGSVLALFVGLGIFTLGAVHADNTLLYASVAVTGIGAVTKVASTRIKARNEREDGVRPEDEENDGPQR